MGFKDWGCWHLVDAFFVNNSYAFLRYNVSHNGGTPENPIDFPDPEAFSMNSYSKELEDFERVIAAATVKLKEIPKCYLIGHSRGGGIATLQAHQPYVKKWCSWAGISSIKNRFPTGEALQAWKKDGIRYVKNGRTLQELPLNVSQYEDYLAHKDRLDIQTHCQSNTKPCMILHGTEDTSVSPEEAENLANWTETEPIFIEGTQHTFGSSHPWNTSEMPDALQEACNKTLTFFEL